MTLLLVGHDPNDPPEATLVLAAAAYCNGLLRDGTRSGGEPRRPSLRELVRMLGIHVDAVRRGVRHLQAAGEARMDGGVVVEPEALRRRWHDDRVAGGRRMPARWCRARLEPELCRLGLLPRALLLAALVAGLHDDRRGELRLAMPYLAERLGLPLRTVERLAATCEAAGALHTWTVPAPGGGCRRLKLWRPGKRAAQSGESPSSDGGPPPREVAVGPSSDGGRPVATWRSAPSSDGGHLPEPSGSTTGSTPGRRVRAGSSAVVIESGPRQPEHPPSDLVTALLRTGLRSQLPPLARLQAAVQLARPLASQRMTAADVAELWAIAAANATSPDPCGLFLSYLADWREVLGRARHTAAIARGAAARAASRTDPYGATPKPLGELLPAAVARMREA